MRKILRTIKEELAELDRRTDFTNYVIRKISVNDDYDDCDEDNDTNHFGVVSLALTFTATWATILFLSICL